MNSLRGDWNETVVSLHSEVKEELINRMNSLSDDLIKNRDRLFSIKK